MLQTIKNAWEAIRTTFYPLNKVPEGFFRREYEGALQPRWRGMGHVNPMSLSPFSAALRLYQQSFSSLPLVTYQKDANGHRERLQDKTTYNILHERPNPGMSRAALFDLLLRDYWIEGECFCHVAWANNHRLLGLFPVPACSVLEVCYNEDFSKRYKLANGTVYNDGLDRDEMIHVVRYSEDGVRGVPFMTYAGESLGLHKQILDTAYALYANAPRLKVIVKQTQASNPAAKQEMKESLDRFKGAEAGGVPFVPLGYELNPWTGQTAEEAQLIEAINTACAEIGRWFDNLSPLLLGDLSRGTYSNSAADKLAFYQKNLLPILDKFQLEINYVLFGAGSDTYCEFLTDSVLRADPKTQADVWHLGLTDGYLLKSEVRDWLNLPAVDGMDVPTAPLNMGAIPQAAPGAAPAEDPPAEESDDTQQPEPL